MSIDKPASLAELTARLGGQIKEKKVAVVKTEAEHFGTVEEYLAGLEDILQGDLDGKTLRYWIDSSALVLGKNLAKESLTTAEGKNVAEGIGEITATEEEIAENNELLQKTAEAAGMTVDELLGDKENEIAQAIARLREEKAAQVAELRTALQAYALELVHTLQEGNRRKLGMTKDELAKWEEKFAAVEALPQDYDSYAARLEQEFISTKRRSAEIVGYSETLVESKERSIAVHEKVWGDYAHHIVEVLEKELPGDENEEKRRHLLAGLLRKGDDNLLRVLSNTNEPAIIIQDEAREALPEPVVLDIAKRGAIASMLSGLKLHDIYKSGSREENEKNRAAYVECVKIIAALDMPDTWGTATWGGTYISGRNLFRGDHKEAEIKTQALFKERAAREVGLANEVDAVVKFLHDGLDEKGRDQVTGGQGDYRVRSPVWRTLRNNPPEFSPAIPAPVSPDGVFYSQMDTPATSRVATQQATSAARAFMQGLSNTLNKDKLQHERRPVTPADVEARNNSRILAAEQQALATMNEGEEGRKAVERVQTEKTAVEQRLQQQIQALEAKLGTSGQEIKAVREELAQARQYARQEQDTLAREKEALVRENETQGRKLERAEKKATDATTAMNSLLEQLREAADKPAGFLGGGLKEAIKAILEKAQSKK